MDAGGTKEQILQAFSDKYGEKILSSPTMVGFNVIAWVMPYVVVGIAVVLILLIISRWGRRKQVKVSVVDAKPRPRTPQEEQMERELKSMDT
jgi:cytochrome c-type biogenesis protein CcmH